MFKIETSFDTTSITLIDDNYTHLLKDVNINSFEGCITIEHWDANRDQLHKVTTSMSQAKDLAGALDVPEGVYQRSEK